MDQDEEMLSAFFTNLAQLCFEKAREDMERVREIKQRQSGPLGMLLIHLPQFALAERSYLELGSMLTKHKVFLRKDNSVKAMYDTLRIDFRRLEEFTRTTDRSVSEVSSDLAEYASGRMELIDLYEKMQTMGSGKQMKFEDLLTVIEDIHQRFSLAFTHISMTAIKAIFSFECEILINLLKAQLEMQMWRFLPALMCLHGAHARFSAWESKLQNKEVWKLGFSTPFLKANQQPALLQWLAKLKALSLSKFSFYFHGILSQQTPDMKALCSKLSFDPFGKIQNFIKRSDAAFATLVLDGRGLPDLSGPGYVHPEKAVDAAREPDCFPVIVSYPSKPIQHMQTIRGLITERSADLQAMDKPLFSYSSKDQCTYVMVAIDLRVTMVLIFDSKKVERETHVNNFLQDMCLNLRCNKIFTDLKPSSK